MKKLLIVASVVVLALSGMACTGPDATPEPKMTAAQERQQSMSWAYEYGETIFVHGDDGYAICEGNTYIASLGAGEYNRIKLSSQETLNLTLCKRSEETGNYSAITDISGAAPGDWLEWTASGVLGWARYH